MIKPYDVDLPPPLVTTRTVNFRGVLILCSVAFLAGGLAAIGLWRDGDRGPAPDPQLVTRLGQENGQLKQEASQLKQEAGQLKQEAGRLRMQLQLAAGTGGSTSTTTTTVPPSATTTAPLGSLQAVESKAKALGKQFSYYSELVIGPITTQGGWANADSTPCKPTWCDMEGDSQVLDVSLQGAQTARLIIGLSATSPARGPLIWSGDVDGVPLSGGSVDASHPADIRIGGTGQPMARVHLRLRAPTQPIGHAAVAVQAA